MTWLTNAISDGEIDALSQAALAACNDDTQYPRWHGSHVRGAGECHNIARWLVHRLGGTVGSLRGHYVWLSPGASHRIDLTNHHQGGWDYSPNVNPTYPTIATVDNVRTDRFTKRADRIFSSLELWLRLSVDVGGDAYPAETPQANADRDRFNDSWTDPDSYWHDEPASPQTPEGLYQFVYANGQLEVSPNHSHAELSGHAGVDPAEHMGPFAAGHVSVTSGQATWEAQTNVNLHALVRILKDATKNYGWQWGGLTDASGQPVNDAFAPKGASTILHYAYSDDHLYIGAVPRAVLALSGEATGGRPVTGTVRISGGTRATVDPDAGGVEVLPALFEWATDNGLTLYGGNDNVIKTIPDLQEHDNYDPDPATPDNPMEQSAPDERLPTGLYRCPACAQLFPNWHEYQEHRRDQESWGDPDRDVVNGDAGLPQPDPGLYGDGAHFTEMRQEPGITTGRVSPSRIAVLPARTWREAARVDGFAKYATAFRYDNDNFQFYVAYRNGDPLGYAAVKPDGGIQFVHSALPRQGIATALHATLAKHYTSLYTNAAHEATEKLLEGIGWVRSTGIRWRWSKDQAPTDMIDGPLPFIYDVQDDTISVGHPGARTSDIPGKFTPGGIVEGTYEPGGKVVIRSVTSIPYTVRHMIELWYYTQPNLEVKSVHLQDDAGKDTRLASTQIGTTITTLVAMDPAVQGAARALTRSGGSVYVVGGAVRDVLLGKDPSDLDLMVVGLSAPKAESVLKRLPGHLVRKQTGEGKGSPLIGNDFGVFIYHRKGRSVQIALARREQSTGPRHQDFAVTTDDIPPEIDLYRRDFTANAMAVNFTTGQLLDPFGGAQDITNHTLRALHDKSLAEDPLRVVRAVVAYARHGLDPDEATRVQMTNQAHSLHNLPAERIHTELDKLMESDDPAGAIRLAQATGVLTYILPEVAATFGYSQNNPHHELDLFEHSLNVLGRISTVTTDPDLRMAALLHDIGKLDAAWTDPKTGSTHFYEHHVRDAKGKRTGEILGAHHEVLSAELTRARLKALKYPTDRITRITSLVGHHMWPAFTTERGARRFAHAVGQHADDLLTLRWADQGGKSAYPTDPTLSVDTQRRLVHQARLEKLPLAIDGNDLINDGVIPGPIMSKIITHLTEQVVDNPDLNTRASLFPMARAYARMESDEARQDRRPTQEALTQGVRRRESQKLAQGDDQAEVEPMFPGVPEAQEIHDQAITDFGQRHAPLLSPGGLESGMGRAANYWHYGDGTPGEKIADSAGALAHGIGQAQAFKDGNKRTAYHTTRYFLHNNDYGQLSPVDQDDEELADHLIGHGAGTHSLEDTQQMFRSRLGNG